MSVVKKVDTYCRPYAIVRCLDGCDLVFRGQSASEHDGENVAALRRLAVSHCKDTGHATEFDLTSQYRFAPFGSKPSWERKS